MSLNFKDILSNESYVLFLDISINKKGTGQTRYGVDARFLVVGGDDDNDARLMKKEITDRFLVEQRNSFK